MGNALRSVLDQNELTRQDLFLQTKFAYAAAQDRRLPFDPPAGYASQVVQSLQSSLDGTDIAFISA
jgi:hypothetical protein